MPSFKPPEYHLRDTKSEESQYAEKSNANGPHYIVKSIVRCQENKGRETSDQQTNGKSCTCDDPLTTVESHRELAAIAVPHSGHVFFDARRS